MTNDAIKPHESGVRLYQVNRLAWGAPVMIAADSFRRAAELAMGDDRACALGGFMVVDATDQFNALSAKAHVHTDMMRASGVEGLVDYDEDLGWALLKDRSE